MYDSIILDVDGTLWDSTDVVAKAWNKAMEDSLILDTAFTGDRLKTLFGKPLYNIADIVFPNMEKEKRYSLIDKCCEYEHDVLLVCEENLLYPKVKETIISLSRQYKVFIVSNCQAGYIELFLEKTGLGEYITDFECYGNTDLSKGKNIKLVIERNNLNRPIYVGDTQGDYEATQYVGIPFIFAAYGFGQPKGYQGRIIKFEELLQLGEE